MGINYSGGPSYAEIVNASWEKCIHVQSVLCVFIACIYTTPLHMLQYRQIDGVWRWSLSFAQDVVYNVYNSYGDQV